jgi:hypothetical protein
MIKVDANTLALLAKDADNPALGNKVRGFLVDLANHLRAEGGATLAVTNPQAEFGDTPLFRLQNEGDSVRVKAGNVVADLRNDGQGLQIDVGRKEPKLQLEMVLSQRFLFDEAEPGARPGV